MASHAGVAPELGVSAVRMAADAITRMELGRLDDATTANIGSVRGGTATNVIPARCEVRGECRSLDRRRVETVRERMHSILLEAAHSGGGSVEVYWTREYEGFDFADDDPLMALVASACRDVGVQPSTYRTGGGSDANVLAGMGVPALALACGMSGVHGTAEHIAVADLETLTRICVAVCERFSEGR